MLNTILIVALVVFVVYLHRRVQALEAAQPAAPAPAPSPAPESADVAARAVDRHVQEFHTNRR